MNPKNNDNLEFHTSEQFKQDLQSLFEPGKGIRPEVDRAVIDQAARQLLRGSKHSRLGRWIGYAAAAAAVIVAGVFLLNEFQSPQKPAPLVLKNDINQDGTVDILDAYKLARQIESAVPTDPRWDMNGDGIVDQKDVDTVAMVAVRLHEGVL